MAATTMITPATTNIHTRRLHAGEVALSRAPENSASCFSDKGDVESLTNGEDAPRLAYESWTES